MDRKKLMAGVAALLSGMALSCIGAHGAEKCHEARSAAVVHAFKKKYGIIKVGPNGQIDHCESLCYQHGPDSEVNLQFICGTEMRAKERAERFPMLHFRCKSEEENRKTMQTCPGTLIK